MTTKIKPDLFALVETLEVVTRAAKVGLWEQETWINSDPIIGGAVEWQGKTFCGTAGCFAGWRAMLDGGEVLYVEDAHIEEDFLNESLIFPDGSKVPACAVGAWAQSRLGLTDSQAHDLFDADNTLADLHIMVRDIVIETMDATEVTESALV